MPVFFKVIVFGVDVFPTVTEPNLIDLVETEILGGCTYKQRISRGLKSRLIRHLIHTETSFDWVLSMFGNCEPLTNFCCVVIKFLAKIPKFMICS
jgi:hypothetical protein